MPNASVREGLRKISARERTCLDSVAQVSLSRGRRPDSTSKETHSAHVFVLDGT